MTWPLYVAPGPSLVDIGMWSGSAVGESTCGHCVARLGLRGWDWQERRVGKSQFDVLVGFLDRSIGCFARSEFESGVMASSTFRCGFVVVDNGTNFPMP